MIAQSKSGTGKTLAFGIPALNQLNEQFLGPQVLILSPTRELALQTHSVLSQLGKHLRGLHCHLFIGGLSYHADLKNLSPCNVVVGTPGRILQLIVDGYLLTTSLRLFVLDEADKMLEDGNMKAATLEILNNLPKSVQYLCMSATYSAAMLSTLETHIPDPVKFLLASGNPSLEGVRQYYLESPADAKLDTPAALYKWKFEQLVRVLKTLAFHQCIVFCNASNRSAALVDKLKANGWPTRALSAQLTQVQRMEVLQQFRDFQIRILLSSDLVARGLDIERINLVINLDLPIDAETYLHRVGRTGRFGTLGVAINILSAAETATLKTFIEEYHTPLERLPDEIPQDLYAYELSEKDQRAKTQLEAKAETLIKIASQRQAKELDKAKENAKKRKRDQQTWHQTQEDEQVWEVRHIAPPPHPTTFWYPQQYLAYITESYLPQLQASISGTE